MKKVRFLVELIEKNLSVPYAYEKILFESEQAWLHVLPANLLVCDRGQAEKPSVPPPSGFPSIFTMHRNILLCVTSSNL